MPQRSLFRQSKTSPEVMRMAEVRHVQYPLSPLNVEDLPHERGIDISPKTMRFRWTRFDLPPVRPSVMTSVPGFDSGVFQSGRPCQGRAHQPRQGSAGTGRKGRAVALPDTVPYL